MIYGYVNDIVLLPQLSREMILESTFLQKLSLPNLESFNVDEENRVFSRKENIREQLVHFDEDKPVLRNIDEICPLQYLDRVENTMFLTMKAGDILITSTMLNFSRYLDQALKVIRFFYEKSIRVICLMEKFDSFVNTLMTNDFYIAFQQSRSEEQRNARKEESKGKTKVRGGKKTITLSDLPFFAKYYDEWKDNYINKTQFATRLSISRPVLDRLIKEYQELGNDD